MLKMSFLWMCMIVAGAYFLVDVPFYVSAGPMKPVAIFSASSPIKPQGLLSLFPTAGQASEEDNTEIAAHLPTGRIN